MEHRFRGVGFDVDTVLGAQDRRQPFKGRRPVVDQQDAPALAGVGHRAALRRLPADLKRGDGAHAQFIGHHLQPCQRTYPRNQHDVGHRLGQEIVGAGLKAAHPIGRAVQRGDHDHRNEMRHRVRFQPAANLETVDIGHHHVEQDDVAFGARADFKRLGAVAAVRTSKYSADSRASNSLTLAGTSSTTRIRADIENTPYPINRRTVSINLPTEIGFDR